MISGLKIFLLIFLPAAVILLFGFSFIEEKNREISADQFEILLKNQWSLVSFIKSDDYESLRKLNLETGLRVTLIQADGKVLFDSEVSHELEDHSSREEIRSAFLDVPLVVMRYSETTEKDTTYYAEKLPNGEVLRVSYPLEYYERREKALLAEAIYSMLVLLTGVAFLALIVSRKTAKTLREMGDAVEAAKNGGIDLPSFGNLYLDSALSSLSQATRELTESNEERETLNIRLEYILRNINDGILLFSGNQILYYNLGAKKILGSEIPKFVAEASSTELIMTLDTMAKSPDLTEIKIGEKIIKVNLTETSSGRLIILHDLTDLEKYSLYKSDLIGNISHELKTPLTIMLTAAEIILKDDLIGKKELSKFLESILRNGRRLNQLLDDLMYLHKLEVVRDYDITPTDLGELVSDIKDAFDPGQKELHFDFYSENVKIHASHLESVVTNLVNNAIKYSSGHDIFINLKKEENFLLIEVLDMGPIIPPQERERIFERFYSISKSRNREKAGTGLGLSIVKHIAMIYEGEVSVEPNGMGGNTFRVILKEKDN
ncbi:MAG: hypothetical protein LBF22_07400 [Deltaproteobacteria bacterium]|jgi:two-component system phosphate regulon sensor histidine kinase PhoR|nr:hypothetical protein [Deltaproteobacteria bacterium]